MVLQELIDYIQFAGVGACAFHETFSNEDKDLGVWMQYDLAGCSLCYVHQTPYNDTFEEFAVLLTSCRVCLTIVLCLTK